MIVSICGLLLLLLALLALALQRFYSSIPAKELKRLAARGDHLAAALYRPVAYGTSMRLVLWTLFGLGMTFGTLCITSSLTVVFAGVVIGVIVAGIVALQSVRLTVRSARVAVHLAPAVNWLLGYIHTPFDMLARQLGRFRTHDAHSGLYEKDDVVALIRQQKEQVDNRISDHDLDIMERAVTFDDRQAADILLPMSQVHLVRMDDTVGPILLKELHDSGQHSFLVYNDAPEHVVGTLFLRDAVQAREGGRVADLVHPKLMYVHEDFSLRQVLQAFIRTNQFMAVVVNAFEEAVGVITLEHLLSELVGTTDDDDMAYDDLATVAAFKPAVETAQPEASESDAAASPEPVEQSHPEQQSSPAAATPSPEATEVVE